MLSFLQGYEELRVVGVAATISHGQDARACVPNIKVFIFKLATVDGFATGAVTLGDVATLKQGNGDVRAEKLEVNLSFALYLENFTVPLSELVWQSKMTAHIT